MVYKVIGIMSGSSLDGIDIVFTELQDQGGTWHYEIMQATCLGYNKEWHQKLQEAIFLSAKDYLLLHTEYGEYTGQKINEFIDKKNLHHQVNLIASHGHTTFHMPERKMTHQLGDGAAIAAATQLPVVSDLRSIDVAFGGQGAPIVPLGEKLLFTEYNYFLNIGGIANISIHKKNEVIAFDICAANRVLNMLAEKIDLAYDDEGIISSRGSVNEDLLFQLNGLEYYKLPAPKSLANSFGTDIVYPLLTSLNLNVEDTLRTYVEHICIQIKNSLVVFKEEKVQYLFITGGGAFNTFLIKRLQQKLDEINFEIVIPAADVVKYKEALIMALLGALRWREQYTVLSSVTGATRNSIGGALWLGTEA
ncbi:anhydro-N-acetylmuramic acid kinase [Ginsengibacter hankyongi]|uniref:Anhydro-N-acetylmuramic acid kinase n=1 Tax=Ginsengibacter hankyongi TaxID=2607284 RepID=A0A5J5IMA8_9BACT|nr:anhydro-N-acetylmuramic acid kinase [Ginsengibacter hankyongi]KAA9041483.1 anhydro-N-acetylmuramic acid kinase [Ginsengibacter hankyongi]